MNSIRPLPLVTRNLLFSKHLATKITTDPPLPNKVIEKKSKINLVVKYIYP